MSAPATTVPNSQIETQLERIDLMHILGDEIRQARKQRRWSRRELRDRLDRCVSLPTLASYELGTRHCSVNRFVEICMALEITASELLARALVRTNDVARVRGLRIDLRPVVVDTGSTLRVFRRWARHRLAGGSGTDPGIHLEESAIEHLAELCGLTTSDLIAHLAALGAIDGADFRRRTGVSAPAVTAP